MSNLLVYKASAGSGKTFRLTSQYLELLFRDPYAYRSILAVTFTNKAAEEMKGRILNELYSLTEDKPYSSDEIIKALNLPLPEIKKRASRILDLILNDFSGFSVETIDRFFQLIIRSFTRETSMQGSYNLEMDDLGILTEATDNLMYELDTNPVLKEWMIRFAEEIISEGKTFNLTKEIINLGGEIFRETFRNLSSSGPVNILDDEKIKKYSDQIRKIKYSFEHGMREFGGQFLKLCVKYDLDLGDFKGSSRSFAHFFRKILTPQKAVQYEYCDKLRKLIDDHSEWYAKGSEKKELIIQAFNGGLNSVITETISFFDHNYRQYSTALATGRFIYAFGILSDLSRHVRLILKERNLFLLSDSSQFLNEIIGKNEAPFIYEKAGVHYRHFMLDEFQDTSVFQWENFKPLISNSLAQGFDNLVVGDVKQSIYRWRNSDWDILGSGIEKTFTPYYKGIPLTVNWRSRVNIVHFNNQIISEASKEVRNFFLSDSDGITGDEMNYLADKIRTAYSDTIQVVPKLRGRDEGYVHLRFFPADRKKKDVDDEIKKHLHDIICSLQDRDYKAEDIAILVRDSKHGKQVASMLLEYRIYNTGNEKEYNFAVISNDSLYIGSNSAVQFLVALLKNITNSTDNINEAFLYHEYFRYILNESDTFEDPHFIFTKSVREEISTFKEAFKTFQNECRNILHLSLFELVEQLIRIFHLNENTRDLPYIQAFQDIVLKYMQKETSDISSFLNFWDEKGSTETLNITEKQDAITIMTIHKAKGLEFKVVIIPYCDWYLDHDSRKTNVLWCKTSNEPFDLLPFVPVKYSAELKKTYFSKEYQSERMHALVDNLNLLYVALTRTRDELYIFTTPSAKNDDKDKLKHVGDLLLRAIDNEYLSGNENWKRYDKDGNIICEFGNPGKSGSASELNNKPLPFDFYPVSPISKNLKIKYHGTGNLPLKKDLTINIDYGIVMHDILSRIKDMEDITVAVERSVNEGKIDRNDKNEIVSLLNKGFSEAVPKEFFSPGWKIYAEREILTPEGNYRPDRIMLSGTSAIIIDFKFGREMKPVYTSQLRNYLKLIKETGFVNVKGYIWYFTIGMTEEVNYEG